MTRWKCRKCSYVYDPVRGDPDGGIAPGTPFARIPDGWRCPVCGATKADFYELAVPGQPARPGASPGSAAPGPSSTGPSAAPPGPGPLPVSTPAERRAAGEADPRDAPPARPQLYWTVGPLKGQR